MTVKLKPGFSKTPLTRDKDGHRTYKISFTVRADRDDLGYTVLQCPGLPKYGDPWKFGNDNDPWATCQWDASANPRLTDETSPLWDVEFTFSTKSTSKSCTDQEKTSPLLEPMKVDGDTSSYHEEATFDRFGLPVVTSSFEQLRGPKVEFDLTRSGVSITQHVASLDLGGVTALVNTLNAFPLWGSPPRTVKLSKFNWTKKYYALCHVYFERKFHFEVRADGFDKKLLDESTKVLNGHWDAVTGNWTLDNIGGNPPNPANPKHFIRYKDKRAENAKVILDGHGVPSGPFTLGPQKYIATAPCIGRPPDGSLDWVPIDSTVVTPIVFPMALTANNLYSGTILGGPGTVAAQYTATLQNQDELNRLFYVNLVCRPPDTVLDGGTYDPATNYRPGSYVVLAGLRGPGVIKVEKYTESDFLYLGIPTDLSI